MERDISEKEGKNSSEVLSSIESLEKNISQIKSNLKKEFSKKEKEYNKNLEKTKEVVDEITLQYKKKLKQKDDEFLETKREVTALISEYDNILAKKEFENKKNAESENEDLEKDSLLSESLRDIYEKKFLELKAYYESNFNENTSMMTNVLIDNIALEYKKRIKEKDAEIKDIEMSVKKIVLEYEALIRAKDESINSLQKIREAEEINVLKFKDLGVPEEFIKLPKEEILTHMAKIIRENTLLAKKTDSIRNELMKKDEDYKTTKKALEKNNEKMVLEYSKILQKNKTLESQLSAFSRKISFLITELKTSKEAYEKNIALLKKQNEEEIRRIASEKTKEQIELEVSLNMLSKQLEEYKRILSDRESQKNEFLKSVEDAIKNTVNKNTPEFLKNYDFENAASDTNASDNNTIQEHISSSIKKGDTKEKIIHSLEKKGYNKSEIMHNLRNKK